MLFDFLTENREEVFAMTENKTLELAGYGPSSDQLRLGLPIFFQQPFYSALSNLIQNAFKYTLIGGKIKISGNIVDQNTVIEVEDECRDLLPETTAEILFKPFEQQHDDRSGLGLGLTIAQKAIKLNYGTIEARNLPEKGCVFKITLPIQARTEVA